MNTESVILVATVQHTGTWFVLDMLKEHGDISNIILFKDLVKNNIAQVPSPETKSVIHVHIASTFEGIHPNDEMKSLLPILLAPMVRFYRTVMTVRDPVRCLISRHLRHPELCHNYIVDGFVYMAECKSSGLDIFFVPVDLIGEAINSTRRQMIVEMARHCNIGYVPRMEQAADEWLAPSYNVTGPSELKDSYQKGKFNLIRQAIENELEYLKSKESIIKPFLKSLGYKNLAWWR